MRGALRTVLGLAAVAAALLLPAAPAAAGNGGVCFECSSPGGEKPAGGDDEVLSLRELRALTRDVGFRRPRVAAAIAMAESAGRVRARHVNRKRHRSVDRGLFQINSRWHPEVSNRCAYDARCNAKAARRISRAGRTWREWATWHNGAYKAFL